MGDDEPDPAWHQALAYALTGRRLGALGWQPRPDPSGLAEVIRAEIGPIGPASQAHPVPADLRRGIGAAQFVAALSQLRALLGQHASPAPVVSDRVPNAEERRLLRDVPPHHGS